jgi:hypothetical protein
MKKYICQFKKANPNSKEQKTILTIKVLRESAGCGLKQAKNVVDGKLALMTETQVINFIRSYCNPVHPDYFLVDGIYGVEWKVGVERYARGVHADLTGYLFVVHREHDELPF